MNDPYYLFMLHEFPVHAPYYCTIGITSQPVMRLAQLQAGNPRPLRAWNWNVDYRPTAPFGLLLPSKAHAIELEHSVLESFGEMGVLLPQDSTYATGSVGGGWLGGIMPEVAWLHMGTLYATYVRKRRIADQVGW